MEIDCTDIIVCDRCNTDYSNSDEKGGLVFCGHSYCPSCAPEMLDEIKRCDEEEYIEFRALPDETFKQMVVRARGGNNTAYIEPFSINDFVKDFIDETERRRRFQEKLKEEENNEESCIWMSFADPDKPEGQRFLGVIIIKTKGFAHAIEKTHEMGINPGGEIYAYSVEEDAVNPNHFNKLLSKNDLIRNGYINEYQ